MARFDFEKVLRRKVARQVKVVGRSNRRLKSGNDVVDQWQRPVLSAAHVPLAWRCDLDHRWNPYLQERHGVRGVSVSGAIEWKGRICLVARVEGADGRSFFAVADSPSGVEGFRFRERPLLMPETDRPDANVSDMRLTAHEDGWTYGLFRAEQEDRTSLSPSGVVARTGVARTRDLVRWERLPDLVSRSTGSRDVVLHPELAGGRYAVYFAAEEGGISIGRCETMDGAEADDETIVTPSPAGGWMIRPGAPPLKTSKGWLHVANGVLPSAAGLRTGLCCFLCEPGDPAKVVARPGGRLLEAQRVFSTGAVAKRNGEVLIYYSSSDAQIRVATSTVDRLLDFVLNGPEDPLASLAGVEQRNALIERNRRLLVRAKAKAYDGLR